MNNNHFSHTGILLKDHLFEVADLMKEKISNLHIKNLSFPKELMEDVATIIGAFHDFGKFTTFFQVYLKNQNKSKLTQHSKISAFVATEFSIKYLKQIKGEIDKKFLDFFILIIFCCINRHHGNLVSLEDEFDENDVNQFSEWIIMAKQAEDILKQVGQSEEIAEIYQNNLLIRLNFFSHTNIELKNMKDFLKQFLIQISDPQNVRTYVSTILKQKYQQYLLYFANKTDVTFDYILPFVLMQLFFSVLVDSDKKIAALLAVSERKKITSDIVDKYKLSKFKEKHNFNDVKGDKKNESSIDEPEREMNKLREKIYQEVVSFAEESMVQNNKLIYTLTAPTGTGKTLAVLKLSLMLRTQIEKKLQYSPRIIYCLPFTSIIDQNYQTIEEVLRNSLPDFEDNKEEYLVKHHHLSDLKYKREGKEVSNEEALMLVEAWESEIIVTTFVQLFSTLFGYRNSTLKKFSKPLNSIIILDEIQAFPEEYWIILRDYLLCLARYFNTKIILITATQPALFEDSEKIEVLKDHKAYFKHPVIDRIDFNFKLQPTFLQEVLKQYKENEKKHSLIFVANTIKSSLEICEYIKENFDNLIPISQLKTNKKNLEKELENKYILIYLSSNIIPKIRKERIDAIKQFSNKNIRFILVTTQLIEAGVDIDAELVVRDFAPIDSLIQISGRCNRNNKRKKGNVVVYNFVTRKNRSYASFIYSEKLLEKTRVVLESYFDEKGFRLPWSENIFPQVVSDYFRLVKEEVQYTKKYRDILYKLKYGKKRKKIRNTQSILSIRDFKLIKEDFQKEDIYVVINQEAKQHLKELAEILKKIEKCTEKKDYFKLKSELKRKRRKLKDYIISVPSRFVVTLLDKTFKNYFYVLEDIELDSYYDTMTGFIRTTEIEDNIL